MLPKQTRFAPIYDSGCSFGRELDDERITQMLNNEQEITKYISKGLAEIHWESNKITHFELVNNLLETEGLRDFTIEALKRTIKLFDFKKIEKIVLNIDKEIIDLNNSNFFPKDRKELVLKLLTLRYNKLEEIYFKHK